MSTPKFPKYSIGDEILETGNALQIHRKMRKGTAMVLQDANGKFLIDSILNKYNWRQSINE